MPPQSRALVLYTTADKQLMGPMPRVAPAAPTVHMDPIFQIAMNQNMRERRQMEERRIMAEMGAMDRDFREWRSREERTKMEEEWATAKRLRQEERERKERGEREASKRFKDAKHKTRDDAERRRAEREEESVQRVMELHPAQRPGWDQWAVDNNERFHRMMEDRASMSVEDLRFLRGNSDPGGSRKMGPLRNFMKN